ncbi:hypothetical protein EVAR_11074_1 [Eumeta japonica]|uniref:Uncharacterized protein n=1 Tax=Eumeta variegata TaxID=151549 RepID=A0A4C1U3S6_EUMVA|nr:hypothetical protein EVAR_11074_1 [Eumeta japonica]
MSNARVVSPAVTAENYPIEVAGGGIYADRPSGQIPPTSITNPAGPRPRTGRRGGDRSSGTHDPAEVAARVTKDRGS